MVSLSDVVFIQDELKNKENVKCVLFDFDCTLTLRDTTRFIVYSFLLNMPVKFLRYFVDLIVWFVSERFLGKAQFYKNRYLSKMLKGCTSRNLERLVSTYVVFAKREFRQETNNKLQEYIENGFYVLIVTASPRVFVESVYRSTRIKVLGVEFNLNDPVFSGELLGVDCFGDRKVEVLNNWCLMNGLKLKFQDAWSDSLSDKSIMLLAERRYWLCPPCDARKVKEIDPFGLIVNTGGV